MNVKKAMDKLSEWNNVGNKLRHHIPENDEVLHSWLSQLEEFSQDLPCLLQLSSDALKVKSMYSIFFARLNDSVDSLVHVCEFEAAVCTCSVS